MTNWTGLLKTLVLAWILTGACILVLDEVAWLPVSMVGTAMVIIFAIHRGWWD